MTTTSAASSSKSIAWESFSLGLHHELAVMERLAVEHHRRLDGLGIGELDISSSIP